MAADAPDGALFPPRRRPIPDPALAALDPAAADRIEIVLAIKPLNGERGSDLVRARDGLFATLNRFCDPGFCARLAIVAPRADLPAVRGLVPFCDLELTFLAEEDLLPADLPAMPRQGWYRQQMIKIAYAALCRTPFYLTLDADVVLVDLLDARVLRDGRAPAKLEPVGSHREWWVASAALLGVQAPADDAALVLGVTPAFIAASVMRQVVAVLAERAGAQGLVWTQLLAAHATTGPQSWTEYSLYWLTLINLHDPEELHYPRDTYRFCHAADEARAVLTPGRHGQPTLFGVLQSSFVPADELVDVARDLLALTEPTADERRPFGAQGGYRYMDPAVVRQMLAGGPAVWVVSAGGTGSNYVAGLLGVKDGWGARYPLTCHFPYPPAGPLAGLRVLYVFDDPVAAAASQLARQHQINICRNNNINLAPAAIYGMTIAEYAASGQDLLNLAEHFDNWTDPAGPLGQAEYGVAMIRFSALGRYLGGLAAWLRLTDAQAGALRAAWTWHDRAEAPEPAIAQRLGELYAPLRDRMAAFGDAVLWDPARGTLEAMAGDPPEASPDEVAA